MCPCGTLGQIQIHERASVMQQALMQAWGHTCWPLLLGTGTDSPVSMDSSTEHLPCTMSPSTGMRSPGSTLTISPGLMLLVGTMARSISRALPASEGSSRDAGFMTIRDCAGISLASVWRSATGKRGFGQVQQHQRAHWHAAPWMTGLMLVASMWGPVACTVLTSASLLQVTWLT